MSHNSKKNIDARIALALFLGLALVYVLTLCRHLYIGTGAHNVCQLLGLSVTPSELYPVWQMLAGIFGGFSRGNPNYGISLFSALAGSATVALLYWTLLQFGRRLPEEGDSQKPGIPNFQRAAALCVVLLLAFSRSFWEASVTAGTDTLNALLLIAPVCLLVKYWKIRRKRYLVLFAFVCALGLVNSPVLLLFSPVFLIVALILMRDAFKNTVAVVAIAMAFVVGLLAVLYQPYVWQKSMETTGYVIAGSYLRELANFNLNYLGVLRKLFLSPGFSGSWISLCDSVGSVSEIME